MSKHSQDRARSAPVVSLASLAAGAVITGAAWIYLVTAAIEFGTAAVNGETRAWYFTLGASVGAVVSLVLLLALVGRGMRTLGFLSEYQPRRAAARRRR